MYISVLIRVHVRVPESVPDNTSTSSSTIALELTSTSKVRVLKIHYSCTASMSTEYVYTSTDSPLISTVSMYVSRVLLPTSTHRSTPTKASHATWCHSMSRLEECRERDTENEANHKINKSRPDQIGRHFSSDIFKCISLRIWNAISDFCS